MNRKKRLKSIKSLEKRKKEHKQKIREAKRKNPDNPAIGYMIKELTEFDKQIKKYTAKLLK